MARYRGQYLKVQNVARPTKATAALPDVHEKTNSVKAEAGQRVAVKFFHTPRWGVDGSSLHRQRRWLDAATGSVQTRAADTEGTASRGVVMRLI